MNEIELKKARVQLYKMTPQKEELVEKLASLIKHCFGEKVEVNGLRFDSNHLKIGDLYVRMIIVEPNDIAYVQVHWYPNYNVSRQSDPFCSAYTLEDWELHKLINGVTRIKEYYNKHIVINSM